MKTYLILPPTAYAATLLKAMTTVWAGGYGGQQIACVHPIVLSLSDCDADCNKVYDGCKQICENYDKARNVLMEYDKATKLVALEKPMLQSQVDFGTWLQPEDRIVVLCQLAAQRNADLMLALKTRLELTRSNHNNVLTVVCELADELLDEEEAYFRLRHSLDFLRNVVSVVFTGVREDHYKKGFTSVQTLVALLDATCVDIAGYPVPATDIKGLSYTQENLQSSAVAEALTRILWLSESVARSTDKRLSTWRKRLSLEADGLPKMCHDHFDDLLWLCDSLKQWLSTMGKGDFALTVDENIWQGICRKLEKTKQLLKDFSLKVQREATITSLLTAIRDVCSSSSVVSSRKYAPVTKDFFVLSTDSFCHQAFVADISPTCACEVAAWAFNPQLANNEYASRIRAVILDLWEHFFTMDDGNSVKVVERCIVPISEESVCLGLTDAGRRQLAAGLVYDVEWAGEKAISSVDVGFAMLSPTAYLRVATSGKELSARSEDFQRFLFAYAKMFEGAFCTDFLQYINLQTAVACKGLLADELNIIRKYPQFRNHVGIDCTT